MRILMTLLVLLLLAGCGGSSKQSTDERSSLPVFVNAPFSRTPYLGRAIETDAPGLAGFNLLLADRGSLWYASNRADQFARELPPGIYGLSNEFLDTPWPKLVRVRARFDEGQGSTPRGASQRRAAFRSASSSKAATR